MVYMSVPATWLFARAAGSGDRWTVGFGSLLGSLDCGLWLAAGIVGPLWGLARADAIEVGVLFWLRFVCVALSNLAKNTHKPKLT